MNKKLGVIVILILIIATVFGTYFSFVSNMRPPSYEKIAVPGLDGEVQVYKDEYGVPHIIATSDRDLVFAQGYVHAQDRMWQLELARSIINGETSRFAGEQNIETDKFLKSLSIIPTANYTWEHYISTENKELIQRYVDGINFYISKHNASLPIEFTLVGISPKNWTVLDVIGMSAYMALSLSLGNAYQELLRRDILQATGGNLALTETLLPIEHPAARTYFLNLNMSDVIFKADQNPYHASNTVFRQLLTFFNYAEDAGSNNWVIGPERSSYGVPILSNDMHLAFTSPSIWYEVHLSSPNLHLWGYSLPGSPFIIVGHNQYVAWGFTNTEADVLDLYYLKETRDGTGYYIGNEVKPFETREESIPVKGLANGSIIYTVKTSEFGPVVNFGDETFTMQWTLYAKTARNNMIKAIHDLNRAQNINEMRTALETFSLPGQNVVMADIHGNFGYQYTGLTPIRKTGYGLLPMNASTGKYGWTGFLSYDEQYYVINPPSGYFATANANHFPSNYTYYITDRFLPRFRYERITNLLSTMTNATVQDMISIQKDTYLLPAEFMVPTILTNLSTSSMTSLENDTYMMLQNWDYNMSVNSIGGLIYQTIYMFIIKNTFLDEFGPELLVDYSYRAISGLENLIAQPNNQLFDNKNTPQQESLSDIIQQSFLDAVNYLSQTFGENVNGWRWGRIHHAVFYHAFGESALTSSFNNGPIETAGAYYTVNTGSSPLWQIDDHGELYIDWEQKSGSSERMIIVLDKTWKNVYSVMPPGQSGNLGSPHYSDQLKDWAEFKYHQTSFNMAYITSTSAPSIILIPMQSYSA